MTPDRDREAENVQLLNSEPFSLLCEMRATAVLSLCWRTFFIWPLAEGFDQAKTQANKLNACLSNSSRQVKPTFRLGIAFAWLVKPVDQLTSTRPLFVRDASI